MAQAWNALLKATFAECERVFGQTVAFAPVISEPDYVGLRAIGAIFDDSAKVVETDGVASVSTFTPMLDISYSTLAVAPEAGDQVVVDGTTYTITDVQAGDADSWRCMLHTGTKARW